MLIQICKTGIRLYWYFIPKEKRIVCLYKDHCSQHVFDAFDQRGFAAGLKALKHRYKNCNRYYTFSLINNELTIKTKKGEIIKENDASPIVVSGCRVHCD
jgi:putative component of membrane protein insertase Oxa1/YidC/SpoIIIJ protein YidD